MPYSAPSRCTQRCGRLATENGRCDEHQRKAWENRSANDRNLSGADRRSIHKEQLEREDTCRLCGSGVDLEADHIIEIADNGSAFDADNLQTLCKTHHAEKSKAERSRRAAKRHSTKG